MEMIALTNIYFCARSSKAGINNSDVQLVGFPVWDSQSSFLLLEESNDHKHRTALAFWGFSLASFPRRVLLAAGSTQLVVNLGRRL